MHGHDIRGEVDDRDDVPGMHKHFRMIAIHNYMVSQGVVNSGDQHTTISGLWTKLGSLYNLPILDEREDSSLNSSSDENGSGKLQHPQESADHDSSAMKFDR
jgi:MRG-binding protein